LAHRPHHQPKGDAATRSPIAAPVATLYGRLEANSTGTLSALRQSSRGDTFGIVIERASGMCAIWGQVHGCAGRRAGRCHRWPSSLNRLAASGSMPLTGRPPATTYLLRHQKFEIRKFLRFPVSWPDRASAITHTLHQLELPAQAGQRSVYFDGASATRRFRQRGTLCCPTPGSLGPAIVEEFVPPLGGVPKASRRSNPDASHHRARFPS